jgi:hypothetical protein
MQIGWLHKPKILANTVYFNLQPSPIFKRVMNMPIPINDAAGICNDFPLARLELKQYQ